MKLRYMVAASAVSILAMTGAAPAQQGTTSSEAQIEGLPTWDD